ncbi:T9SS type A sorting domain-containing protein [Flavobacterium sp. XGLA_31]|uniref:T9SS type A sorting domain-containing protein n=1 Tax=Flavobacterium sp. XGLA_31 TaxID=3447666 RepID=UPI003F30D393
MSTKRYFKFYSPIVILIFQFCHSQAPTIQWQKSFGGTMGDVPMNIKPTSEGGYIVSGFTYSNNDDVITMQGVCDFWLVKIDGNGNLLWQKTFGGTNYDFGAEAQQTTDGGYIIAGTTYSNDGDVTGSHGERDFWVVKTNLTGNLLWQKTFGGSNSDEAHSIKQTSDGGYIVVGSTYSNDGDVTGFHGNAAPDCWIVKLDENGELLWQKALGGSSVDGARCVQQTTDGGYIVVGTSRSIDGDLLGSVDHYMDDWVVKLDSMGNIIWQKKYGGLFTECANSVQQTIDGGYVIAGYSTSNNFSNGNNANDFWIIKIDADGMLLWQKNIGGTGEDVAYDIKQTADEGYVVSGSTYSFNGDVTGNHGYTDCWIVKLGPNGNLLWQKAFGSSSFDSANSIIQTTDEGIIFVGSADTSDGDVIGGHGYFDFWIVKLYPDNLNLIDTAQEKIIIYPNPISQILNVKTSDEKTIDKITIFNLLGEIITEVQNTNKVAVENIAKGVYLIQVSFDGIMTIDRFVKE